MNELTAPSSYEEWLQSLKERIAGAQLRAALAVEALLVELERAIQALGRRAGGE